MSQRTGKLPRYQKIGPYRCIQESGEGGMGVVFRAQGPNGIVAIKVLHPNLTQRNGDTRKTAEARFDAEVEALRRTANCEHIPGYLDHGVHEHRKGKLHYLVTEYLNGDTLGERLLCEKPSAQIAVWITKQICRAVIHAHSVHVVHRDLKPGNIFLARDQVGCITVKVLDFGIARLLDREDDRLTMTGFLFGTPRYMSPEQFLDNKNVDERSDQFSIGCILYRMLTGVDAFPQDDVAPAMLARMKEAENLERIESAGLRKIVARTLAMKPEERYGSVSDLLQALEAYRLEDTEELPPQTVVLKDTPRSPDYSNVPATELMPTEVAVRPTVAQDPFVRLDPHATSWQPSTTPKEPRLRIGWGFLANERAFVVLALIAIGALSSIGYTLSRPIPAVTPAPTTARVTTNTDRAGQDAGIPPDAPASRPRPTRPRTPNPSQRQGADRSRFPTLEEWRSLPPERRRALCQAARERGLDEATLDRYCIRPAPADENPFGFGGLSPSNPAY